MVGVAKQQVIAMSVAVDMFQMDQDRLHAHFPRGRILDQDGWETTFPEGNCVARLIREGIPQILEEIKDNYKVVHVYWVMYCLSRPVPTWIVYARVGEGIDIEDNLLFPGRKAVFPALAEPCRALLYRPDSDGELVLVGL
jgi:hypothetical protein